MTRPLPLAFTRNSPLGSVVAHATLPALKRKKTSQHSPAVTEPAAPLAVPLPTRRNRRWIFRGLALLLPFAFLGVAELALRAVGFGYPTGFFVRHNTGDRKLWVENYRFGWRFFPPRIARTPEPIVLPAVKPEKTYRIFVFGESAAMGDPEPAFGVSRFLEVLLQAQFPEHRIQVVNVAMTAINSHVIRDIARDCARQEGDAWIIYMGNNEVVGPFGAGTVFGPQVPARTAIRASIALQRTRLGQGLRRLRPERGTPSTWGGMEMFLDQQLAFDHPRLETVYAYFRENLAEMIERGRDAGVEVVVSTVISNLRDCPPFASASSTRLTPEQRIEWDQAVAAGTKAFDIGAWSNALPAFQRAQALDPGHAELAFRLGRTLLATGDNAAAKAQFLRARDLDTLRFRVDSRLNDTIRQIASSTGIIAVDSEAVFAERSHHGIIGDEWLYEHVHLNPQGTHLLAQTLANALLPRVSARLGVPAKPALDYDECLRRLAWTDWNRFDILDEISKRLEQPPFTTQLGHAARQQRLQAELAALRPRLAPDQLGPALERYTAALAQRPDDFVLQENYARLLEARGEMAQAAEAWQRLTQLLPHHAEPWHQLGNLQDRKGDPHTARQSFQTALAHRPDLVEAMNGLGLVLASLGQTNAALEQLERASRLRPELVQAHVNRGQILAQAGRISEAIACYQTALRLNSNSAAAHLNFGKLLADQAKTAEAIDHYQAALRIQPHNAIAHFNLANAFGRLGQTAQATNHYAAAVQADPHLAEARYHLGLELARTGNNAKALEQFAEVVRLRPEHVEAHFNLGVAYAKERRFPEAMRAFETTLRLAPGHAKARQFLAQAAALQKRN